MNGRSHWSAERESSLDRVTSFDPAASDDSLERTALRAGLGGVAVIFVVAGGLAVAFAAERALGRRGRGR
jgi:hypothetical protein